jgi:OOP family OmpA-OmpF porin
MKKPIQILVILLLGLFILYAFTYNKYCCNANAAITPLPEANIEAVLEQTPSYLKSNTDRKLTISILFGAEENNESIFPDFWLARAAQVKKLLISLGAPASKMFTSSNKVANMMEAKELKEGLWHTPLHSSFSEMNYIQNSDKWAYFFSRMADNPIFVYFDPAYNTLELSSSQRQDFAQLIDYLSSHTANSIMLTRLTDSKIDRDFNVQLGLQRTESVQVYLARNDIAEAQLLASSKGPNQPIADNSTEERCAQNRRVEVNLE